jgi:hypothetical protein
MSGMRNTNCKIVCHRFKVPATFDSVQKGARFRMDIRFVSSLTAEDENLFAPALLKAVGALLDQLPIAYTVRIETTGAQVFQHAHAGAQEPTRSEPVERLSKAVEAVAFPYARANGSAFS